MPTKFHLVKAMVFPVVMYGCESWTVKNAEHWRIDAFELWCWRRLLRVCWTARRSNQSILKEISPGGLPSMGSPRVGHNWSDLAAAAAFTGKTDAEAEAPILWLGDAKSWLTGKDPDAGQDWGQKETGTTEGEMVGWHHQLDGLSISKLQELVMDREAWRVAVFRVEESERTEQLNWSTLHMVIYMFRWYSFMQM